MPIIKKLIKTSSKIKEYYMEEDENGDISIILLLKKESEMKITTVYIVYNTKKYSDIQFNGRMEIFSKNNYKFYDELFYDEPIHDKAIYDLIVRIKKN